MFRTLEGLSSDLAHKITKKKEKPRRRSSGVYVFFLLLDDALGGCECECIGLVSGVVVLSLFPFCMMSTFLGVSGGFF